MNRRGFLALLGVSAAESVVPKKAYSFMSGLWVPERHPFEIIQVSPSMEDDNTYFVEIAEMQREIMRAMMLPAWLIPGITR